MPRGSPCHARDCDNNMEGRLISIESPRHRRGIVLPIPCTEGSMEISLSRSKRTV